MSQKRRAENHGGGEAPASVEPKLGLEDLAMIVSGGTIEDELQDRVASVIRSDPRFAVQFEELEAMSAEAGAADLWDGFER